MTGAALDLVCWAGSLIWWAVGVADDLGPLPVFGLGIAAGLVL